MPLVPRIIGNASTDPPVSVASPAPDIFEVPITPPSKIKASETQSFFPSPKLIFSSQSPCIHASFRLHVNNTFSWKILNNFLKPFFLYCFLGGPWFFLSTSFPGKKKKSDPRLYQNKKRRVLRKIKKEYAPMPQPNSVPPPGPYETSISYPFRKT